MADQNPLRFRVRDRSGRSVRVQRRYLILIALGFAAAGVAFLFIPFYVTSTPGFCFNCHIMEPFVDSWENSTHSKFGCTECHVRPGVVNHFVNQLVVTQNVYLNVVGRAEMPEQIRSATNENCLQAGCHTTNRRASTSGDLIIPHREHVLLRDLECKDCHYSVVHTPEGGTPLPPMGACAMCHDGQRASSECGTCHRNPPSAEEEHPGLALEAHAEMARGRERDCFKCHHSDQGFCARSGCHDPGTFERLTAEERLNERFGQ